MAETLKKKEKKQRSSRLCYCLVSLISILSHFLLVSVVVLLQFSHNNDPLCSLLLVHCVRRLRLQPRGCNHVPRYQEQRSHQIATISVHQISGQYTRHGWVMQISSWNFLGVLLYTFPIMSMSRVQSRNAPQFNLIRRSTVFWGVAEVLKCRYFCRYWQYVGPLTSIHIGTLPPTYLLSWHLLQVHFSLTIQTFAHLSLLTMAQNGIHIRCNHCYLQWVFCAASVGSVFGHAVVKHVFQRGTLTLQIITKGESIPFHIKIKSDLWTSLKPSLVTARLSDQAWSLNWTCKKVAGSIPGLGAFSV